MTNACIHGHLARVCLLCEYEQRIAELEREVEALRRVAITAEQVATRCKDMLDYFAVPSHVMAALTLGLDDAWRKDET